MIQQTPQADLFKKQLGESLQRETLNSRAVKIARHDESDDLETNTLLSILGPSKPGFAV